MHTSWRLFSRHRSLAAAAVSTLAGALGLAAALTGVAQAILFRPLPVARPNEIVRIFTASAGQPAGLVSYPDFADLRRNSRTLAGIVAQSQVLIAAGTAPASMRLALAVTPDYFDLLGVRVAPGRGFRAEESSDAVVVLAYDFWQSQFAGDARAVGRTLLLCGTPFTIAGIAPRGFGLDRFSHEDLYFPIGVYQAGLLPANGRPLQERSRRFLNLYARLAPGATLSQARSELTTISARLETQYAAEDRGRRAVAETEFAARTVTDRTMPALAALLSALAFLIAAIACGNLAALLLARSEARVKEIAVRMALGAAPARLRRDSLTEIAALSAAGLLLAIPLALSAQRILASSVTLPTDFRFSIAPVMDARVLLLLIGAAALIALLCGALPVSKKVHIARVLQAPSASSRGGPRRMLAAAEIALATALIACTAFLLGGISAARHIDPGYRTGHVLVVALDPAQVRFGETQARAFYDQVLARVREMSGVKSAELAQSVPLGYTGAQRQISIDGQTLTLWMNIAGPRYFELMHLPILAGRAFDQDDTAAAPPVAIVNQELARRCGLGCTFRMGGRMVRVVGIARTARYFQIQEAPRPYFYLPFSQNYASRMVLHVETAGDPAALAHAVADEIHRLDPGQPLSEIRPLRSYLDQGAMFQARVGVRVLGSVALIAVALALAGLYAAMSHAASRRRREIGIRMACGANRSRVVRLLAGDALGMLLPGLAIGLAAASGALRILAAFAPQGGPPAAVLWFAAALVTATAAPASLIPAFRAASLDPARALRCE